MYVLFIKQLATYLFYYSKFEDIARVLLEHKDGDINLRTIGGFTSLMMAATNNEHNTAKFLCNYDGTPTLDLEIKVKLTFHVQFRDKISIIMDSKTRCLSSYLRASQHINF